MHNFRFCQPVGKPGEFFRDIVYNYTLKNKQGQWFSSHFLVQQNAVFWEFLGAFITAPLHPHKDVDCPEPAGGAYGAITFLYHSKTG